MAKDKDSGSDFTLKTVFNMDLAYLERIDKLLYFFDMAMLKYDPENATLTIKRIYSSICPKLTEEEEKEINTSLNKIYSHRNNYNKERERKEWVLWFDELEKLDMKLKKLMKKYGIIFQDTEDPRFAALRR